MKLPPPSDDGDRTYGWTDAEAAALAWFTVLLLVAICVLLWVFG